MEQNFNINDIETVLSKVLDDYELKQVLTLFKNYKKDEKISRKVEEVKSKLSLNTKKYEENLPF